MANANTNTNATKNSGLFDVTKVMGDFRVPGIDLEAAVASQRKNIEALTQANQLAVEGVQALMRRQVEITRQVMEDFSAMFRDFVQPNGSPEDRVAKQAEYSKQAIEKGLAVSLEQAMTEQREYPAVKAMTASQDYIEGPKAFSEKRAPKWLGR